MTITDLLRTDRLMRATPFAAAFVLADAMVALAQPNDANGTMPPPEPERAFSEREITAPGPSGPLNGTLTLPSEADAEPDADPIILIVPGSGPTDRDGNSPLGIAAASYRMLAHALAERDIASVRIDKRGMHGSSEAVTDANAVTIADYADDVVAWTDAIRTVVPNGAERCIVLLGHSEGGLVALEAVPAVEPCGVVLIAVPGRPFGTILREQLAANPANAPILDQADAAIASMERGERVDAGALHPGLQPLFDPSIQGFLIDLASRDPARMAAPVDAPVLIVQGARDIQVAERDARALDGAAPASDLLVLADMNHVLKAVTDDRADNLASYADPDRPLAPSLADAIARFVANLDPAKP